MEELGKTTTIAGRTASGSSLNMEHSEYKAGVSVYHWTATFGTYCKKYNTLCASLLR